MKLKAWKDILSRWKYQTILRFYQDKKAITMYIFIYTIKQKLSPINYLL